VILSFKDQGTADVFNGVDSKAARAACPRNLWPVAYRKLDMIRVARALRELAVPPANRLEPLKGDQTRQHSIRINQRYRICFVWTAEGARDVEIVDYH
jgi:toxin HigB-1